MSPHKQLQLWKGELFHFWLASFCRKNRGRAVGCDEVSVVLFKTRVRGGRKAKPVVAISFPVLPPKALIRILAAFSYLTKYLHKDRGRRKKRTFSSYIFRFCPQLTKITNLPADAQWATPCYVFINKKKKKFVECSYCTTSSSAAWLPCRRYGFGQITHLRAKKKLFSLSPNEQMLSEVQSTS